MRAVNSLRLDALIACVEQSNPVGSSGAADLGGGVLAAQSAKRPRIGCGRLRTVVHRPLAPSAECGKPASEDAELDLALVSFPETFSLKNMALRGLWKQPR
mmetsp:Transcript_30667/g.67307  ORF Transcript_30667/g.67307 Transcript_30667/m.67307 type:complete len:101 (-) Transcript_30667:45-347(-)